MNTVNHLYYGDNLDVMRKNLKSASVDLVYLDPPFKSNRNYNSLSPEEYGSQNPSKIKAFEDTWKWNAQSAALFKSTLESAPRKVAEALKSFHTLLGENDMLAYLLMLAPRLVELHRVMKPTASVYLHCDPTASHYIKVLMDVVFGSMNFQNEIIWAYRTGGATKKRWSRKHDTLLFYTKSDKYFFNCEKERIYYEKPFFNKQQDKQGRYYADVLPVDWWVIPAVINVSKERQGYPTQKPEALLESIIGASSREGDTVLDPFCGSGTTLVVAERMKRRWIGIDMTKLAKNITKKRLCEEFGGDANFTENETSAAKRILSKKDNK